MSIEIKELATVNNDFKKFIQSGNYEKLIFSILNSSVTLFENKYEHVKDQYSGQCDFINLTTGAKYDAKLPFTSKQGKLIGSNNSDFQKWLRTMLDSAEEFGEYIDKRGAILIENLSLYSVMKARIESVSLDENVIFFFPYPIVLDSEDMGFIHLCGDMLSAIFSTLKSNQVVKNRKIYAIYPCYDGKLALRLLNSNMREYIYNDELKKYISYTAIK